ncbi:MAG: flagellar motor switch protein FliN [Spirochaetaceae bacterium]|jgi:flagellar motor switch protein FliN/FliY|nr:flagellar motor switch protein FliN [Spirochaetaceae bacterium]
MSDGSLSQEEIDALLNGADASALGGAPAGAAAGGNSDAALQGFLGEAAGSVSSGLSGMLGGTVTLGAPQVSTTNQDGLVGQLPEQVVAVKADFSAGVPGEHLFILDEDTAKAIAALMNKEENIELDDMAMSVLGEVMNQMTSSIITAFSNKTGNNQVAAVPPQATHVPKAVVALPAGNFTQAEYSIDLGDGKQHAIREIYATPVSQAIATALSPQAAPAAGGAGGAKPAGNAGFAPAQGGMGSGGYGFGGPVNVQSVQYPNLTAGMSSQEAGNIGLILDVPMEVTVELGRTKKQIKEILSFGEGTIIELDKLAGEAVDILVNHKPIAKGEVVVIDENFGVRITDIVSPIERVQDN